MEMKGEKFIGSVALDCADERMMELSFRVLKAFNESLTC